MANGAPMHHVDVIRDYWHTSEYTVLLAERARDPEVTFKVTIEDDEANDVGEVELETSDTVYTLMAVLRRQEWFAVTSGRGFRLRFGRTLLRGPKTMFELGIGHAAKIQRSEQRGHYNPTHLRTIMDLSLTQQLRTIVDRSPIQPSPNGLLFSFLPLARIDLGELGNTDVLTPPAYRRAPKTKTYQILLLHHGTLLQDDDNKLSSYGVVPGDIIHLCRKTSAESLHVTVFPQLHPTFTVVVPASGTVASLKSIIDKQVGVPPACQRLTAHRVEMRDDERAIGEYATDERLLVWLAEQPRVTTMTVAVEDAVSGKVMGEFRVDPRDTGYTLMAILRRRMGAVIGKNDFYLGVRQAMLWGDKTLEEYGVRDGELIGLFYV
ncbi:hypothetical protein QJS10_CPB11g00447 [Acorus calamus]|uniref:Ubiquitin-like domain-containing protein n=1 Tax=Acorus calamus TaxID=4465 RepID=A0AAV9DTY2_ACOCL|nr:hypothetical protein QJS10_CPB11g00447 [Acorus calamus]